MPYQGSSDAILIYNKKILLFLRDNIPNIADPDKWCLPGGSLELGESNYQALQRELKEEINIIPSDLNYVGHLVSPNNKRYELYFGKLTEEEAKNIHIGSEGQEIRFFSFDELADLKFTRSIAGIINEHAGLIKMMMEKEELPKPEDLGLMP
ncbi:MAG: NUDIX domain-containing protein [Candidatus Yanofskybacteria bacterium]|nr:NUDIX domain-containing protein [Candidatus Yanofskybacteria bacterium]